MDGERALKGRRDAARSTSRVRVPAIKDARHIYSQTTTMSLATTVPRKTAQRLAKPATRYWKGKAPKGAAEVQSDSDEDEDGGDEDQEQEDIPIGGDDDEEDEGMTIREDVRKNKASINIALRDVAVSKEGKVIVAGREESGRTALEEEGIVTLNRKLE